MDWQSLRKRVKHTFDEPFENVLTKKTARNVTAGALSAYAAWKALQYYKKKHEETGDHDLASSERIKYLKASISKCQYTHDPLQCKLNIQKQIRSLQNQKK